MVQGGYIIWRNTYSPSTFKLGNGICGSSVNEENSTPLQYANYYLSVSRTTKKIDIAPVYFNEFSFSISV
jgi:hypothetical protein